MYIVDTETEQTPFHLTDRHSQVPKRHTSFWSRQKMMQENSPITILNHCQTSDSQEHILYYHSTPTNFTAAGKRTNKIGTVNFLTSLQPPTGNDLHMSARPARPLACKFLACLCFCSERGNGAQHANRGTNTQCRASEF